MKKNILSIVSILCCIVCYSQVATPNWTQQLNTNFPNGETGAVYIDVVNDNVIWVVGKNMQTDLVTEFVTRSINGGANFTVSPPIFNPQDYIISNIDGIDNNTAWIATHRNGTTNRCMLYKTTNGGATWLDGGNSNMFNNIESYINFVAFCTPSVGVACGDAVSGEFEIFKTTDGGITWNQINGNNIPNTIGDYGVVNCYEIVGNTIWFGTSFGRIFKSTDAGSTWSEYNTSIDVRILNISFTNPSDGIAYGKNQNTNLFELFNTTNGGMIWNPISPLPSNFGATYVTNVPGTNILFSCSENTLVTATSTLSYSTDNGVNWTNYGGTGINYLSIGFSSYAAGFAGSVSNSSVASIGGMYKYSGNISTSIEDKSFKDLMFFPNPTNDLIRIVSSDESEIKRIKFYSSSGLSVMEQSYSTSNSKIELNCENLPSGKYFSEIELSTGRVLHNSFVILRN
jgi:photosystem II stability/assembly factor-like uncharacterized protein